MSLPLPAATLEVCVVVPARDEEALIGRCLTALAAQTGLPATAAAYEVLLVLDHCADATGERALRSAAEHPDLTLHLLQGPGRGAGHARKVGMDAAGERLLSIGHPDGLIASTDADTVVAPDWLERQLAARDRGARAIGGQIELHPDESGSLSLDTLNWRRREGDRQHRRLLTSGEDPIRVRHWQFGGASLSLTAATYAEIGGLPACTALEDEKLEQNLRERGIEIERLLDVRVQTSARRVGRARRGLAQDLALTSWFERNTTSGEAPGMSLEEIAVAKHRRSNRSVGVVLHDRPGQRSATRAALKHLASLQELGLVDEVVVLQAAGPDEDKGPELSLPDGDRVSTFRASEILPGYGPCLGAGDALWRGLAVTSADLVLFPGCAATAPLLLPRLLQPLLTRQEVALVQGYSTASDTLSELVARPLVNLYRPELAGLIQPLSSALAVRRTVLEGLSLQTGDTFGLALLLDVAQALGPEAVAQSELDFETGPAAPSAPEDAYEVLAATCARAHGRQALDKLGPGPLLFPADGRIERRRTSLTERPRAATLTARDPL